MYFSINGLFIKFTLKITHSYTDIFFSMELGVQRYTVGHSEHSKLQVLKDKYYAWLVLLLAFEHALEYLCFGIS